MIHAALHHLAAHLNLYVRRAVDLGEDIVVLSNMIEQDGQVAPHVNNKLVMSLVNIEKDTVSFRRSNSSNPGGSRSVDSHPPIYLNLHLMVAAHFSGNNYPEALKFISHAIGFFQRSPVFDHHSTPDLDPRIEKLVLDIENLSIPDLSNLWGVLSGKYLPSVLYKVRMVGFDAADVRSQTPTLKDPQASLSH